MSRTKTELNDDISNSNLDEYLKKVLLRPVSQASHYIRRNSNTS